MPTITADPEPTVIRQVFTRWSISIPKSFRETFVHEDGYWHAWDDHRSVSMSSVVVDDRKGRPVKARQILRQMKPMPGKRVAMPPALDGWGVVIRPPQPARASRAISGVMAVDGRVLIATVTSDDLDWANAVWQSISLLPAAGTETAD